LLDLVRSGRLGVHVAGTYPLEDAAGAHRDGESGRTTGKLVLVLG
jgi:NADPH:quinone reductase-like Zn-dependent oxidoreductase